MSVFLDASAIVAILTREVDGPELMARLEDEPGQVLVSAIALFEATISIASKKAAAGRRPSAADIAEARATVGDLAASVDAREIALSEDIADMAIEAAGRFGKVVGHPARLNMGDCFAYACARASGAALLYKGDDFAKTDIQTA